MIECSHDCFNCPYPDVPEECLNAPLTDQERAIADKEEIEQIKQLQIPKKLKQMRIYRRENRQEIQEKERARRNGNLEERRRRGREYQRKYRAENKRKYGGIQKKIAQARRRRGWTQAWLAELIGVSEHTVLGWENGYYPANWDLLVGVLPELRKYVSRREA